MPSRVRCSTSRSAAVPSRPRWSRSRSTAGRADPRRGRPPALDGPSDPSEEERAQMAVPADLRYTKDHEWVRLDGDEATVGITAYAAEQLGDIVFVELPEGGRSLSQFAAFGVVESVKAV